MRREADSEPHPVPPVPAEPSTPAVADATGAALGTANATRRGGRPDRHRGAMAWLRETAVILIAALLLSWVVKTFLVQAFYIPSPSMAQTLIENDRILVSKLTPGPFDLHRGDVVVFKDPGGWLEAPDPAARGIVQDVMTWVGLLPTDSGEHLVKRVIGLPGDEVACAGPGEPLTVNGEPIDEPYLAAGSDPSEIAFDEVVPAGHLWVMGDNRQHSADSRYNLGSPGGGFVPVSDVVGVAFVTVWPLDRATLLRNPSATFAEVPAP